MQVKITTPSIFKFLKIIKKTDISLKSLLGKANNTDVTTDVEKKQEQVGIELFTLLFENIDKAEEDIYKFCAEILQISVDEYKQMDVFTDVLPVFSDYAGWKDFFTKLASLEKSLKK